MDAPSLCLESGLESPGKGQEAEWQDASFTFAKEKLVEEFFLGQRGPEVVAAQDRLIFDSSASDCSCQLSPKSTPHPTESKGRRTEKRREFGRRAVFVVLTGGHTKPAVPLTREAKEALLERMREVEGILNIWQPSVIYTSTVTKKVASCPTTKGRFQRKIK